MDGAVGIKGNTSKGDAHITGKDYEKMEANLKGGTTFQFVYSFEVEHTLKELQETEAGREVEQAIRKVEAALEAAKLEQKKKKEKVFGGVSRRRNKNTGPSEVEIALEQLENIVNEKYSKLPEPTSTGGAVPPQDGRDKGEKADKHQPLTLPTLPVYISNIVSLYRGMVEMSLSLQKSQRERSPSPDKEVVKERNTRAKNKSARMKRVKSVMK